MNILKKLTQFSKKGNSIVASLTKMESELSTHIDEAAVLQEQIIAEIVEIDRKYAELEDDIDEKQVILENIQELLGRNGSSKGEL